MASDKQMRGIVIDKFEIFRLNFSKLSSITEFLNHRLSDGSSGLSRYLFIYIHFSLFTFRLKCVVLQLVLILIFLHSYICNRNEFPEWIHGDTEKCTVALEKDTPHQMYVITTGAQPSIRKKKKKQNLFKLKLR